MKYSRVKRSESTYFSSTLSRGRLCLIHKSFTVSPGVRLEYNMNTSRNFGFTLPEIKRYQID